MARKTTRLQGLLLEALEKLHAKSSAPYEEQWFSRVTIAKQLGAGHGLNPARVDALKLLVEDGKVSVRQKPNDGRDFPQYQLPR